MTNVALHGRSGIGQRASAAESLTKARKENKNENQMLKLFVIVSSSLALAGRLKARSQHERAVWRQAYVAVHAQPCV
jgi:hypothetical protein